MDSLRDNSSTEQKGFQLKVCIPGSGIAVLAVPAPVVHSELLAAISQGIPSREKFAI